MSRQYDNNYAGGAQGQSDFDSPDFGYGDESYYNNAPQGTYSGSFFFPFFLGLTLLAAT